jgi:hypothetical protein
VRPHPDNAARLRSRPWPSRPSERTPGTRGSTPRSSRSSWEGWIRSAGRSRWSSTRRQCRK